ncbi:TPA: hypothetical protein QDC03_000738 [Burkholderia cepacia]|uniref:hypothetical protein n=1 Tax=Burkholderia cepacia TaxID=292 RepID=UPI0011B1F768|nr:hypothetical protein [Burkholderia cepacia]HDR9505701.1 hypothetical protein [Burkholderia cepacia]
MAWPANQASAGWKIPEMAKSRICEIADSHVDRHANQGGEIDISRFKKTIRTCHICRIGRAERERISGRHMLTTARETVRTAHPAYRKIEWKQVIRQTENDASRQLTCLHRRPNAATKNFDRHLHEFHHCRVLSINTFRRQII